MTSELSFEETIDKLSLKELEEAYAELGHKTVPVSMDEFLDSDEFLGGYFQGGLYPYWRAVLNELYPSPFHSEYFLVVLRGAIGLGKTTIACVGISYDLYRLQCMISPQKEYDLIPTTKIVFAIFNTTLTLASDVIWDQLTQMFAISPYFSKLLGPLGTKKGKRDTLFPNRIDFFIGSRIGHTLGRAVFDAVLDESNFEVLHGQVRKSFDSLLRRMESRFQNQNGGVPGKIWIVSSESEKSSVVDAIVKDYKNHDGVFVSQEAIWNVLTHKYGTERFHVFKGSEARPPEIISTEGGVVLENYKSLFKNEPHNCIEVPVEHYKSFESDIYAALRDLAGIPIGGTHKLFRLRDRLHKAAIIGALFPEVIELDFDDDLQLYSHLLFENYFKSPLGKGKPRFIHIDIGLTGDLLGIAAAFISKYESRISKDPATFEDITELAPIIDIEWAFGVKSTPGKQVPLFKIRSFIQWLKRQGVIIAKITCDGYQSADMLQLFEKMGYDSELLSVDRTVGPFLNLRNSIYEGKTSIPKNSLLKQELEELEVSATGDKIDHPEKGSKDIADAVAGSHENALKNAASSRFQEFVNDSSLDNENSEFKEMFWPKR